MRLATAHPTDQPTASMYGPVVDGRLFDVSERWTTHAALLDAVMTEDGRSAVLDVAESAPSYALDELTLELPVPRPERILCVGVNYASHRSESVADSSSSYPTIFIRLISSLVPHGGSLVRPTQSQNYDYEGELAVIIGKSARGVTPEDALNHVAGYSCFMDGSLRDYQRHTAQNIPGKNFDQSGAFGPHIVTADELGDASGLAISTTVSGDVLQSANTSELIHTVADIISYCSNFTTLEPGDVIATGTPSGVGYARKPPRWLVPGDEVVVSIERVGELTNTVVDAT